MPTQWHYRNIIYDKNFKVTGIASTILTAFPFVEHLPVDLLNLSGIWDVNRKLEKRYRNMIEDRKVDYHVESDPECLTDAYLKALSKEGMHSSFTGNFI